MSEFCKKKNLYDWKSEKTRGQKGLINDNGSMT